MCSKRKTQNTSLIDRTLKSVNVPKHSFDVLKYTLTIDLVSSLTSPYPNSFVADVKILFRIDSTLNQIVLDANNTSLVIDSVRMKAVSFTHSGNKLSIQLDRTYTQGEHAEVRIFYRHKDVTDQAFYASGGFAFTDSEPEGARKWMPCYDKPSDKATTDITAKVPFTARLGSNGKLLDSIVNGSTIMYHWVSRDPVATYLIVLTAKNDFKLDIVNWINPKTSEIIPMRFYYNAGENISNAKKIIGNLTTFFSKEFGDHPFEKNGFAALNSEFAWGGMENQTLTSLCPNCWGESLIAHEFVHQWFGDMITCATWADIFLNEGFATWAEAHWLENQSGYIEYKTEMKGNANYYLTNNPRWAISTPSWAVTTPSTNTLFNYAITYMKGSCVLHMLRYTLGDSKFFPALKAYATDTNFKYKAASIEDFKNKMEKESGQELDWFFDQWVYKPDHPVYQNVYGIYSLPDGKWSVQFIAKQQEKVALPYFQMPIEIKISFIDGTDSIVKVFNSFNSQNFVFEFNKKPKTVVFDPNNEILLKTATLVVGLDERTESNMSISLKALPNPISNSSEIEFRLDKPSFVTAELYNSTGIKITTLSDKFFTSGKQRIPLNGEKLKAGTYFVVFRSNGQSQTLKIIKNL